MTDDLSPDDLHHLVTHVILPRAKPELRKQAGALACGCTDACHVVVVVLPGAAGHATVGEPNKALVLIAPTDDLVEGMARMGHEPEAVELVRASADVRHEVTVVVLFAGFSVAVKNYDAFLFFAERPANDPPPATNARGSDADN